MATRKQRTGSNGKKKATTRKKRTPPAPRDPLTPDQVHELIAACSSRSLSGIRNRAMIALLFASGCRSDELLNIHYKPNGNGKKKNGEDDHNDLSWPDGLNGWGVLKIRNGKGAKAREVRVMPMAREHVDRWLSKRKTLTFDKAIKDRVIAKRIKRKDGTIEEKEYVRYYGKTLFCSITSRSSGEMKSEDVGLQTVRGSLKSKPISLATTPGWALMGGDLLHIVKTAGEKAGLSTGFFPKGHPKAGQARPVFVHALRHSCAYHLHVRLKWPVAAVSNQLGHADTVVTGAYLARIGAVDLDGLCLPEHHENGTTGTTEASDGVLSEAIRCMRDIGATPEEIGRMVRSALSSKPMA